MSDLSMSLHAGQLNVMLNEYLEEQDIQAMLKFDPQDVEELLRIHASQQAYWEALAIRLRTRFESFDEDWARRWWAHNKMYARYVLASYGDNKPTVDAIRDMVVLIYSSDTTENERTKYATLAFGAAAGRTHADQEEFTALMYKFLHNFDPPWYFETLIQTLKKFQEDAEMVQRVAKRLDSRSFHLDLYAKMQMAKRGNIGPMSVDEGALMRQIGKGVAKP